MVIPGFSPKTQVLFSSTDLMRFAVDNVALEQTFVLIYSPITWGMYSTGIFSHNTTNTHKQNFSFHILYLHKSTETYEFLNFIEVIKPIWISSLSYAILEFNTPVSVRSGAYAYLKVRHALNINNGLDCAAFLQDFPQDKCVNNYSMVLRYAIVSP